ncbi:cytochrome P450 [Pseudomonas sp. Q2-TVG4-2]|uniref:cytochrome P450 n=1 Tax=Pseudomonas sp. Q2-TVG4-2 TaxID=1685699 RepID=UPI0015E64005|nr:cytochrome P450 [Pseudomonas sp. Q2-TVG4-2]
MPDIPRDSQAESSLSLLSEGYSFIPSRCRRLGSDLFQVRLLMQNTICMSGEDAAKLFYDEQLFQRQHAAPRMLQKTLFGQGGVQGLDGEAHRYRKQLFSSLLTNDAIAELVRLSEANWLAAMEAWQLSDRVVLMPEVQAILTRSVCEWAGVPLVEHELTKRRDQLAAMIDGAGGVGARHWRARKARKEAERWIVDLINRVRDGTMEIGDDRALAVVARYRDTDGAVLEERIASVEMLNLLRPTVAVARFIVYAAMELLAHPQWRQRLQEDNDALEPFAQEVRRLHAFFPFTAARVRKDFEWKGYHFPKGTRVLLDLYGTNRDARLWAEPEVFRPERFATWDGGAFNFITQGGGSVATGHRCPGEPLAIALLTSALRMLTRRMNYAVPAQDLHMDESRMPAQPEGLLVISDIRPVPQEA